MVGPRTDLATRWLQAEEGHLRYARLLAQRHERWSDIQGMLDSLGQFLPEHGLGVTWERLMVDGEAEVTGVARRQSAGGKPCRRRGEAIAPPAPTIAVILSVRRPCGSICWGSGRCWMDGGRCRRRRRGIVKLTGKPPKSFHWDSILAVDDPLISHLRRRVDAQRLSTPHSVPLFFRDHRSLDNAIIPTARLFSSCRGTSLHLPAP
jgi:hypothetical protein